MHEEGGKKMEPIENVGISVPAGSEGPVIAELGKRKGMMTNMIEENGIVSLEFTVPTRGLLGFKSEFTTMTKGEGLLSSSFDCFEEYKGTIEKRAVGSMISMENGKTMAYSLFNLQDRGIMFVSPQDKVYSGMVIGEHGASFCQSVNIWGLSFATIASEIH